ncbi:MAG: SMC family ATPase, partial [Candidatus Atribacteria bacterium]|nr:SMC family ATPase [Candidatus Atribacteria bacterium]
LTWAIWGEGRKAHEEKKADRGLLKIGENQMWVDLIVDLEGERYRIIRKFSIIRNKNHSELELQVFDSQKNDFISLSAPSIRQTQERINSLLRMDYNTFINSAFILQGRVDEFTRKSARERKEILAEVLGLSHYEALSVLARQHMREVEKEIIAFQSRLEQISKEVAQKNSVLNEIRLMEQEEQEKKLSISEKKETIQQLEKEYNKLYYDQQKAEELKVSIKKEQKELSEYERRKKRIAERINNYQVILSQEKEILSAYDEYLDLSQQSQQLLALMQKYRELEKAKREVENEIANSKNYLLVQLEQNREKYREVQDKVNSLAQVKQEIGNLELQLNQLNALIVKKEQIEREGNLINIKLESNHNQIKRLQEEIEKDEEKINLLREGTQKACPLCQSPLDEQKKEKIKINLRETIKKNELEIGKLSKENLQLTDKKNILQQEWKKIQQELPKKDEIQNRLNTCYLMVKEAENAARQLKELEQKIKSLQVQISQNKFAQQEREKLSEIEKQIKEQNYSDQKYLAISQKLEALKEVPLQREKLLEAKKSLTNLEEEKLEISQLLKNKKASIDQLEQSYETLTKKVVELPDLEKTMAMQQKILVQLQKEQDQLFLKKGASQEKLTKIEQYQKEQQNIAERQQKLLSKKEIYEKLIIAFGKNGIPAMIIENTIPELEEEANAILARLTDEQTTVSFESLRELQSGEVKETLDIKIHDEMGIRPYELYSGGETFRIDFAIRIALSKLLTYRAGARLRTLVIDEGFGTQDEEGLQKLILAINAIQNDFDKILVITHLSILKDAFPVRIEVWKDPVLGSQFQLIHL